MIKKRTQPLTLDVWKEQNLPSPVSLSVDLLYFFGLYAVKAFSKLTFWPGECTVEADTTRFWFCYRLDFLSAVVCPQVLWVFPQSFGWWTISRLYFNFLNHSAKISQPLILLLVRNDKLFNDAEQFWTRSHREQPCALVFCVNLYWQRQEVI